MLGDETARVCDSLLSATGFRRQRNRDRLGKSDRDSVADLNVAKPALPEPPKTPWTNIRCTLQREVVRPTRELGSESQNGNLGLNEFAEQDTNARRSFEAAHLEEQWWSIG